MPKNNSFFKKPVILCMTTLLLLIIVWVGLASLPASSQEYRVYSLEADVRNIESRLSRIEAQLNQGGGTIRVPAAPSPSYNSGRRQKLSSDPMFDHLATLAIELKERMDKLDARLSRLESRVGVPRTR